MIKKLTQHGNSLALIIDRPILELIGVDADTSLQLSTDGRRLIVTPVDKAERSTKIRDSLARINRAHGKTLRRLAE